MWELADSQVGKGEACGEGGQEYYKDLISIWLYYPYPCNIILN